MVCKCIGASRARRWLIVASGMLFAAASCQRKDGKATSEQAAAPLPAPKAADIPPPPDVSGPPADSEKTASGLAYRVLKQGTGKQRPTMDDTVEVHYTGWTTDGRMFDSSVKREAAVRFSVNGVIK